MTRVIYVLGARVSVGGMHTFTPFAAQRRLEAGQSPAEDCKHLMQENIGIRRGVVKKCPSDAEINEVQNQPLLN